MRKAVVIAALCVCAASGLAQTQDVDALVASKVKMIEEGKAAQVKLDLPDIVSRYQNHPGVLYLQGLLAANAAEAAKYYQMVLDNFPKSEWADDALYRIYLYYYSLGLARTAELKMQQLRKDYPRSPYIKTPAMAQVPPEEQRTDERPTAQPQPVAPPAVPPVKVPGGDEVPMPTKGYVIQVGAFASLENAMRLKAFFEELNYPVEVQNKVRGGRSLHLVWVGNFTTADEARKFGSEIKSKHNIESIVVAR